jgi:hypothetical protein
LGIVILLGRGVGAQSAHPTAWGIWNNVRLASGIGFQPLANPADETVAKVTVEPSFKPKIAHAS